VTDFFPRPSSELFFRALWWGEGARECGEWGWGGGMGLGYIRKFFNPELNHPLSIPISPIISLFG
jgi:hypothetical protein